MACVTGVIWSLSIRCFTAQPTRLDPPPPTNPPRPPPPHSPPPLDPPPPPMPPPPPKGASGQQLVGGVVGVHNRGVAPPPGFGPFQNWRKAMDPTFDGHVYRAEYNHPDSVALAYQFSMGGTTIVCAHPNQIKQASLIENIEPSGPLQQRLVLAGTTLGSKDFAAGSYLSPSDLVAQSQFASHLLKVLN